MEAASSVGHIDESESAEMASVPECAGNSARDADLESIDPLFGSVHAHLGELFSRDVGSFVQRGDDRVRQWLLRQQRTDEALRAKHKRAKIAYDNIRNIVGE